MAEEKNTDKLKPLIKWTGGKFREFQIFKQFIPADFDRYMEPFAGGAGVFFALQPKGKSLLNDASSDLISFYKLLQDKNFEKELRLYVSNWAAIRPFVDELMFELSAVFSLYRQGTYQKDELLEIITDLVEKCAEGHASLFEKEFSVNPKGLMNEIKNNIVSKFQRILIIETREKKIFSDEEMADHIETAFKSGFYIHFRNVMNENRTQKKSAITEQKRIANWYIVRELCYASMFRFNAGGGFNIPYGGIAYNKKNLEQKVNALFKKQTQQMIQRATFFNLDFEKFLDKAKPKENDFVFLDPPYDSEFSEYDNMSFTKDDHARLAKTMLATKCRWMLVIRNTSFIFSLYDKKPNVIIKAFDKTYTYNVRGRNARQAEHLIIMNYEQV